MTGTTADNEDSAIKCLNECDHIPEAGSRALKNLSSLTVLAASAKLRKDIESQNTSMHSLICHHSQRHVENPEATADAAAALKPIQSGNKLLFIFSEDNIIRKYARIIIDWGYPFIIHHLCSYWVNLMFILAIGVKGNPFSFTLFMLSLEMSVLKCLFSKTNKPLTSFEFLIR